MVTKKVEEQIDIGDKLSTSLSFKKNLGNYENIDLYAGVTITKRSSETDSEAWTRAWKIVENELDDQFEKVETLLSNDTSHGKSK